MADGQRTSPRSDRSLAKTILGAVVLLLIPAACALAAMSSHVASGPGWVTPNYDVEYTYLLDALRFQQRLPILFFIQPATTLAMLYAAIIHIAHAIAPVGNFDVVEDVWRYPDVYLDRVHACLVVLLCSASFAAGVLVWRRTRSLASGLALQTGLILFAMLAVSAGLIWPETLTAVVGVLFAGTLVLFILDDGSSPRLCVALGLLGALGIATKLTFAIVTLAPAVLSRSRKQAMLYLAVLIGGTVVLVAPILGRIPQLIAFLAGFGTRTGDYGTGSAGLDMRTYLHGAELLVRQNKIPAAVIVISVGVLFAFRSRITLPGSPQRELRALGVLTLLELLQYALVARQAYPRYLIPAVLLMGVNLVIIQRIGVPAGRRRGVVHALFVLGFVFCSAGWLRNTASAIASARSDTADHLAIVEAAASLRKSGAVVVMGLWASSPARGLANAQFWAGNAWSTVAEKVYPGQLFLTGEGYLKTWQEGLGRGWDWPNVGPPLSHAAEELEWRRFETLLKDRRVIAQGEWEGILPGLQRNPRISLHVIRRSRLESLIELRLRD